MAPILNSAQPAPIAWIAAAHMIAVTVRTRAVGRLPALVLLLLLTTSLFTAPPSVTAGALEATLRVAESVRNEASSLEALAEPLASPVAETKFGPVVPATPWPVAIVQIRTHQVLRL